MGTPSPTYRLQLDENLFYPWHPCLGTEKSSPTKTVSQTPGGTDEDSDRKIPCRLRFRLESVDAGIAQREGLLFVRLQESVGDFLSAFIPVSSLRAALGNLGTRGFPARGVLVFLRLAWINPL